ncbi:MAG: NAD-binding oxidoreductase, partial [Planctomycetes bacterium]|nr:NAD-binding oxidoreductase [Planctomycetota bacterium]
MKPVTVALVGAGTHARTIIIPSINQVEELRLVALATARPET